MPLYNYRCNNCGHEFEILESMRRKGSKKCRVCGGKAGRVISSSSFQFRGSGFHCTDYSRYGRINKENI